MEVFGLLGGMSWESNVEYAGCSRKKPAPAIPAVDDRDVVHRIYHVCCRDIFGDDSRATSAEVIDTGAGVGAVVLCCTEIELLVGPRDITAPIFASTALHLGSALQAGLR